MFQRAGDATGLGRAAPSSALRLRGRNLSSCRLSGEVAFLHITSSI
jgi:hypothetical protein